MKNTFWILALGAAFAASATMAKADPIIMTGSQITATGANDGFEIGTVTAACPSGNCITFAPNGSTQGNYQVGGVTGTFATYFQTSNPITWNAVGTLPLGSMSVHTPPGGSLLVLTIPSVTPAGETLTFTLTSESWTPIPASASAPYGGLDLTGFGVFNLTGSTDYTPEDASFTFSTYAQSNGTVQSNLAFSGIGTALGPVPEPSSLALLGTGLLGAAMAARRRFSARMSS